MNNDFEILKDGTTEESKVMINVIDQIQKVLENIENLDTLSEEKKEEIQAKFYEIKDEYGERLSFDFNNEHKDYIKDELEKIISELDKEDEDDVGDTNYYLDDSFKKIKYERENSRVINLKRDFLDGIIVMPDFQRKYVWSKKQVVELIVSFLLNIPIPTLYAYSEYDEKEFKEKIYIIDGQQRLTSLLFYYYSIFPKSLKIRKKYDFELFKKCEERLWIKEELKNSSKIEKKNELKNKLLNLENDLKKNYDIQLDVKFQTRIEENNTIKLRDLSIENLEKTDPRLKNIILTTPLEITMLKNFSNLENLSRIFNIYNSKGKPLTEDEIRKSLYNKNYLYQAIGEYCLKVEKNKNFSEYSKFNSTDTIISEKRLLQLLSYYFNLTMKFDSEKKWYVADNLKIKKILNNKSTSMDLIKGTLDPSLSTKSVKGKRIENVISEYSKYISKPNEKESSDLKSKNEFETIEKFFKLKFNRKEVSSSEKYSFKNLITIYILVRYFNLLDNKDLIIDREILCYKASTSGALEKERIVFIYNVLKERGLINE